MLYDTRRQRQKNDNFSRLFLNKILLHFNENSQNSSNFIHTCFISFNVGHSDNEEVNTLFNQIGLK